MMLLKLMSYKRYWFWEESFEEQSSCTKYRPSKIPTWNEELNTSEGSFDRVNVKTKNLEGK